MTDERHTQESVLTPEFARALVLRIAAFRIASVLLEDLSQEALLRGVRAFQRIHVEHPSAFFAKIVRDTISDHWRRERVWFPLEDLDPRRHSYILQIEERIDLERRIEQLREALRYLSSQGAAVDPFALRRRLVARPFVGDVWQNHLGVENDATPSPSED